jgi:hypothetical protein
MPGIKTRYSKKYISFSIGFLHVALLRHNAPTLRSRFAGVWWSAYLGGPLACEPRYTYILKEKIYIYLGLVACREGNGKFNVNKDAKTLVYWHSVKANKKQKF